jgi:hypothetical protein
MDWAEIVPPDLAAEHFGAGLSWAGHVNVHESYGYSDGENSDDLEGP